MDKPYILIVDDDAALLQALPQALKLRLEGTQIDTSDAALAALQLIQEHDYDAIVSDIKMPGMDGLALLTKIKEIRPETPTLLITGHGEHDLAVQALRGGAYDFIQKPIDRDYFVAALKRAIQTRQLSRQVAEQQQALELYTQSLEQKVRERTQELAHANAAKDEFLSIASHELKTPLSSMKGIAQLLQRRLDRNGEVQSNDLLKIERAVRRMEMLVNDLLDTSLIETGTFRLDHKPCNMVELCELLIQEYSASVYPQPMIVFEHDEEAIEIEVDVERLSQVIVNLLANARKYSPEQAPIKLSLHHTGAMVEIAVHDHGSGIPEAKLPHIFERFYRVPGVEVQSGSSMGLGLGLYISHKIIECHNGRIQVESVEGEGSTFTIVLPSSAKDTLPPSLETRSTTSSHN